MNTIEKKSVKVGKYVSTEHVDSLVRNYKKERWMHNTERMGKEDSLSVWYSADELEEFVQTAKQNGADGIRLYFGVYGEENARPGTEGKQTVAFVATCSQEDAAGNVIHKDLLIHKNGKPTVLAYNLGGLFPAIPAGPGSGVTTTLGLTILPNKDNQLIVI